VELEDEVAVIEQQLTVTSTLNRCSLFIVNSCCSFWRAG
jgi:hypothetical protein